MADLYATNNDPSFSSSSSLESEDMSFLQSFLQNPSVKGNFGQSIPSPPLLSTELLDSDQGLSDLSSFYSPQANQVQESSEVRQSTNGRRSSKRTRAAEIHNMSEKRRRSRINEKLKALQTLVPNSNKTDKASMLDEAIEYLKQLQLKVQTLTMRSGLGLQPVYSEEQELHRGIGYEEGYKMLNLSDGVGTFSQNQGFLSIPREFDTPNHIGMPLLTCMMKPDPIFGSELANENQFEYTNHSTSMIMKDTGPLNTASDLPFSGKIHSPGISS